MRNRTLFKSILFVLVTVLFFASCDKEINTIGSQVIGDNHFGFLLNDSLTVNAFTQATGAVQSNNLPINSLGIYNNPVFGKTKAGFVTQLQMAAPNPTFDPAYFVSMDSVVLTVPYFSTLTASDATGNTYELDSINGSAPINLKIFESGYYLSDFDPTSNFQNPQSYFTNQESVFDSHKIGLSSTGLPLNNSSNTAENTSFVPSPKEFLIYKRNDTLAFTTTVDSRYSPRMSLHLDKNYFYNKILKAPAGSLLNNSVFKDYFRGLYFQVADADNGTSMRLNFTKGDVTLYYKEYSSLVTNPIDPSGPLIPITDSNGKPQLTIKTYVLNMQGSTVNLLEQTNSSAYANAIASRPLTPLPNDKSLYLKGGANGSAAIIDLFGPDTDNNGVADELEAIRKKNWLINEANLTFYINQPSMASAPEPQRIFLFDINNRQPLYDYVADATVNANPKLNKSVLSGLIVQGTTTKRGVKYEVRITNHIRNLVKYADSTNVRLGLVVMESIGVIGNSYLQTPVDIPYPVKSKNARPFDRIPNSSVMNPLGTILYGANIPFGDPYYDERLKLNIYYTKPN